MNTFSLHIDGMDCGGCVSAVEHALQLVPGVVKARADLAGKRATVDAAETVTGTDLVNALERAGYEARIQG
jgi:copper chaperone CopZ